jgi:hypothetical protein
VVFGFLCLTRHSAGCSSLPLIFLNVTYMHNILYFLYPLSVVGCICWFHGLAIVNRAVINRVSMSLSYVYWFILLWICVQVIGRYILVCWGASTLISTVVVLVYIPLHMSVPFPPHPHQDLSIFLMIVNLTGVRWNQYSFELHSFMDKNIEHFFMYLLAI